METTTLEIKKHKRCNEFDKATEYCCPNMRNEEEKNTKNLTPRKVTC